MKKKIMIWGLTVFLILATVVSTAGLAKAVDSMQGGGTASDPWVITTVEQLAAIGTDGYGLDDHYLLKNDLDLSNYGDWVPIGSSAFPFNGDFDGNSHIISGITINGAGLEYLGLFAETGADAMISKLTLIDVSITSDGSHVGGLTGWNAGTIDQSCSEGTIDGNNQVGGLVGYNKGIIKRSCSSGGIVGGSDVGGLSGYNKGTIKKSYSTTDVKGTNNNTGGLVGQNASNKDNRGTIERSYSSGSVDGWTNVGGFVGNNFYGTIMQSYSTGAITKNSEDINVGGFVGSFEANENLGTIQESFWNKEGQQGLPSVEEGNSYDVTGLSNEEMHSKSPFDSASWDFDDTWSIIEGITFPFFISSHLANLNLQLDRPEKNIYSRQPNHNILTVEGDFSYTSGDTVYIQYSIINENNQPVAGHDHALILKQTVGSSLISFNKSIDINDDFGEGDYTLEVTAKDLNGGESSTSIPFTVDLTNPEITLNGNDLMTVATGETFDHPGVSATDNVDGDITEQVITSGEVDTDVTDTYELTYSVSDSAGNRSAVTRTVKVTDQSSPNMVLELTWKAGTSFTPTFMAKDIEEGDLSKRVKVSGEVNTDQPGVYLQTYSVADSSDNQSSITLKVNVVDKDAPVIQLKGDHPLILKTGEPYQESGYIATDNVDGDLSDDVEVAGQADSSQPGTYTKVYSVTDKAGNRASVERTILIVEENVSNEDNGGSNNQDDPIDQNDPTDQEDSTSLDDPIDQNNPPEDQDESAGPNSTSDSSEDNSTTNHNDEDSDNQTVNDESPVEDDGSTNENITTDENSLNESNASNEDHILITTSSGPSSPSYEQNLSDSENLDGDSHSVIDKESKGGSSNNMNHFPIEEAARTRISDHSNEDRSLLSSDKLTKMPTILYNFLIAGGIFMILGTGFLLSRKRKRRSFDT